MHVMGGCTPLNQALGALFAFFIQRAFHNSFAIKRFRTLSQNCRVYALHPILVLGQPRFLFSTCATRAFTIFLTSAAGSGLSVGNWMVPLEVE